VRRGKWRGFLLPFCTLKFPAVCSAFEASRGKFVSTTDAAMVRGASCVSSSSDGMRSFGEFDSDMLDVEALVFIGLSVCSSLGGQG